MMAKLGCVGYEVSVYECKNGNGGAGGVVFGFVGGVSFVVWE